MKKEIKDLSRKFHELGLTIIEKAKSGFEKTKKSIENTLLEDQLRRRFNLENPYKFQIVKDANLPNIINDLLSRHAKRFIEDELFVFYGTLEDNDFQKGSVIRDMSTNKDYLIQDLMAVTVGVELDGIIHEVDATAAVCKAR